MKGVVRKQHFGVWCWANWGLLHQPVRGRLAVKTREFGELGKTIRGTEMGRAGFRLVGANTKEELDLVANAMANPVRGKLLCSVAEVAFEAAATAMRPRGAA
jgi:hypothetical protein